MSAARARISPAQQAHHRWTDTEIDILRTCYETQPASQVAERLGRSVASIRMKAHRLAMRQFPLGDLTPADVAQVLGRDQRTIRRWLSTGQLRGKRGPSDDWHVRPTDLRAFASSHAGEVNRERADIVWLLQVMGGKAS